MEEELVYFDGKIAQEKDFFSSIKTHFLFLGCGVFTTLLVEGGKIFFFEQHRNRLKNHAKAIGINFKKNDLDVNEITCFIKQIKGYSKGRFRLKIIILKTETSYQKIFLLKKIIKPAKEPIRCLFYSKANDADLNRIKSLSYLPRVLIHEKALSLKVDDLITFSKKSYVLEGAYSNLFWIEDDKLFTPSFYLPILKGITIQAIMKIAPKLKLQVIYAKKKWQEISKNSTFFRCNCLNGPQAIGQIESEFFKVSKELFEALNHEYEKIKNEMAFSF